VRPNLPWLADFTYVRHLARLWLRSVCDRRLRQALSADAYQGPRLPASFSTLWSRPYMTAGPCRAAGWFITETVRAPDPVPDRLDPHSDRPLSRQVPQGASEQLDPHSDRPRSVSFLGPVGRSGTPCGEDLPRRCM
jgi:hypothetical protein